ncbi:MAG: winged helix-turn-helix domain-containing protein [Solirubrobacteraceae bacterium]|nr:winged helix-turn-helix domain-containing protein [Solirubrobacteraceae bacterium]
MAFDAMPWGAAVIDDRGVVATANRAMRELLGAAPDGSRCCDVLPCRDGERGCVRMQIGHPETLVPVPRDGRAWLTARPLEDGATVVFLRAAEVPASAPAPRATPRLSVSVLGRCRIESTSAGEAEVPWLEQRPGQLLRFLVAARGRTVSVDEISEGLWPGGEQGSPGTVRYLVHTLRDHLEPDRAGAPSSYVVAHRGGYRLEQDLVSVDADTFEREATDGLAAHDAGGSGLSRRLLERAASRYRGEFLAEEPYADWAFSERERLRWLFSRVLRALADQALRDEDTDRAADRLAQLCDLEPLDIGVQRNLIDLCLERGRGSEASRRYDLLCRRLEQAYGRPHPGFAITSGPRGRLVTA